MTGASLRDHLDALLARDGSPHVERLTWPPRSASGRPRQAAVLRERLDGVPSARLSRHRLAYSGGLVAERVLRRAAAALLMAVGLLRGLGALTLLLHGKTVFNLAPAGDPALRLGGGLAFLLCAATFLAGARLMRSDDDRSYAAGVAAIVLLYLDGILNGYLVFGAPRPEGQIGNGIVLLVVLGLIYLARGRRSATASSEAARRAAGDAAARS